jgi:hypothetical protein
MEMMDYEENVMHMKMFDGDGGDDGDIISD